LYGAALGAVLVNWAKTNLSERYPSGWLYLQGGLFVVVMVFAPRGVAGVRDTAGTTIARLRARRGSGRPAAASPAATIDTAEATA
jgi:urea transport system permease protein